MTANLRVAIIGGIFQYPEGHWTKIQTMPEINLLRGLRERGHEVTPVGIRDWPNALRVAAGDADVVHVHQIGRATLALSLRRPAGPLVYTPHSCADPRRWDQQLTHTRMLRRADAVVALSPPEAARYGGENRSTQVAIIPNGMDVAGFPPVTRRAPSGAERWRLLYVGQLIPLKQVDLLIRAVASAPLRGRTELRLIYHNDACAAELRRLAGRLGVSDHVVFAGRRFGPDLVREYHDAHIHLLASRTEALPSVITEAMLTGLPVVAPDVGGIAWQLDGWGRCLGRATVDAVVDAVLGIMKRYETYANDGAEMVARTGRRFSVTRMVERHEELYRSLVQ
jgi:glycosyltransferase involved in cell wall biosynthesis